MTTSACKSCEETVALWKILNAEHHFNLSVVDLKTKAGRQLSGEKTIFSIPVTLINNWIAFRGIPKPDHPAAVVRS